MPAEDGFEQFWKAYPKKCSKGDARKAWKQTEKIRPPLGELLKSVYASCASKQWLKDDGDFIPYPATWLRGERWEDQLEVDLGKMENAQGKVCAYCGDPWVAITNGKHHCRAHTENAQNGDKAKVITIGDRPLVVDKKLQSCGS